MKSLIIGVVILAAAVFATIPAGLGWGQNVLIFLRGGLPVIAVLIGIIAVFIGIADMKDRAEAKKEEAEAAKDETKETK